MDDALAEQWRTEGYIVVRGLFDPDRCRRLLAIAESALEQWRRNNPETGEPGGGVNATVMRHLNHPGYFASSEEDARCELLSAIADRKVLSIGQSIPVSYTHLTLPTNREV